MLNPDLYQYQCILPAPVTCHTNDHRPRHCLQGDIWHHLVWQYHQTKQENNYHEMTSTASVNTYQDKKTQTQT
jgi:hypothetical protein